MTKQIQPIDDSNIESARNFLALHEETAQFLINNLREFGPHLTDEPHSGNFKIIVESEEVKGVFFLTRVGNLIAQTDDDYSHLILESCKSEAQPIKGFIGDWKTIEPLVEIFRKNNQSFKPSYDSKEILYRLMLNQRSNFFHDPRVRLLCEADYNQWLTFRRDYENELHLESTLSDGERRKVFKRTIDSGLWWGLFEGTELSSMASLNSKSAKIGQIGGVFTPKPKRKRGLSKATMCHLLKDCRDIHGHLKSILFTGQTDIPAQRLYESIGYEKIGNFALIVS